MRLPSSFSCPLTLEPLFCVRRLTEEIKTTPQEWWILNENSWRQLLTLVSIRFRFICISTPRKARIISPIPRFHSHSRHACLIINLFEFNSHTFGAAVAFALSTPEEIKNGNQQQFYLSFWQWRPVWSSDATHWCAEMLTTNSNTINEWRNSYQYHTVCVLILLFFFRFCVCIGNHFFLLLFCISFGFVPFRFGTVRFGWRSRSAFVCLFVYFWIYERKYVEPK